MRLEEDATQGPDPRDLCLWDEERGDGINGIGAEKDRLIAFEEDSLDDQSDLGCLRFHYRQNPVTH